MWTRYCNFEIDTLQPDIVIGVGKDVANAISRNMSRETKQDFILLHIPFPGRLNLNSRWVPEGKCLVRSYNYDSTSAIDEINALLQGTPDSRGLIERAIKTDWYYLIKMKASITKALASHGQ